MKAPAPRALNPVDPLRSLALVALAFAPAAARAADEPSPAVPAESSTEAPSEVPVDTPDDPPADAGAADTRNESATPVAADAEAPDDIGPAPDPQPDSGPASAPHDAAPSPSPELFVMQPTAGPNVLSETLESIVNAVAAAAEAEGLRVTTYADATSILSSQVELSRLGADAPQDALAVLGRAVGARHVIALNVSATQEATTLQARLIDTRAAKVLSRREVISTDFGSDVLEASRAVARLSIAPIFGHLQGVVRLEVSEEGANVALDGDLIGVTPLDPFEVPGGHHVVTVSKEGFIRHLETLRITDGSQELHRAVALRPSAEYLATYRGLHGPLRVLAWVTTLAAIPLLGAGGTMTGLKFAQDDETLRVAREYESLTTQQQLDRRTEFEERRIASQNQAQLYGDLAVTFSVVGAVSAAAAVVLWIFGEDPDRYAQFE